MANAFTRTLRSLESDRFRSSVTGIAVAVAMLSAWGFWSVKSRIPIYETTENARLEIDKAVYPIQSPVPGRVTATSLANGREVKAGEVLFEIDAGTLELQFREERSRLEAIDPELQALHAQVSAHSRAASDERQSSAVAIDEAKARSREAEAPAHYAEGDARRMSTMRAEGLIAQRDLERALSDSNRLRAAAESAGTAATRLGLEQQTRDSERAVLLRRIEADISKLEGERSILGASLKRLSYEIERRRIRAPVSGRIGESVELRTGAVLEEGERVGTILPLGQLKIVAEFPPPSALGRIRQAQSATLRLRGFPWAQYGIVQAHVFNVADEVRNGTIRVELALHDSPGLRVPLQHGMPGELEVEVERVAPVALILRAVGQVLAAPRGEDSVSHR